MKRLSALLLILCLLLWGCGAAPDPTVPTTLPAETEAPLPVGFYQPDSPVEQATGGAVRAYPLEDRGVYDIMPLGSSILLLSTQEQCTHLTVLSGDTLYLTAQRDLPVYVDLWSNALQVWDNGISYFDSTSNAVVILDLDLEEVTRISLPPELQGSPLLSQDRSTLYYCDASSIRALELETGIRRVLKEAAYLSQSVTSLLLGDTVLECTLTDADYNTETLYISTETGETLYMTTQYLTLSSAEDTWYATLQDGPFYNCIFGQPGGEIAALSTQSMQPDCCFLPQDHAAVVTTWLDDENICLDYYDLETGLRTSSLVLETPFYPWSIRSAGEGRIAFLNLDGATEHETLYLWDTTALPTGDTACYTGRYYTWYDPDTEGLAACAQYAEELEQRHGVNIFIYEEALEVQPWDYSFEAEYVPRVLMQELTLLDQRLSHYPEGFLLTLAERYDSLNISLVRSIYGTPESGSLETANGLQFWPDDSYDAYIVMATGADTEYTLYHELCHLIDTVVINETNAYDQWDLLNPVGFSYDYDYIANQTRNSDEYLREEKRYFIDTYSMSFPKEDRARIMEFAMAQGNESYFDGEIMQNKLRTLCEGIRKAFGLKKSPEVFLWEQYLKEPLAYTE